jgi:hypothetical protein
MSLQKPPLEATVGVAVVVLLASAQAFAVPASSEVKALAGKPKYRAKSSITGA